MAAAAVAVTGASVVGGGLAVAARRSNTVAVPGGWGWGEGRQYRRWRQLRRAGVSTSGLPGTAPRTYLAAVTGE